MFTDKYNYLVINDSPVIKLNVKLKDIILSSINYLQSSILITDT